MPYALEFDGNSYVTAATLGNILSSNVRVEFDEISFDATKEGYIFSQAGSTGSLRELGLFVGGSGGIWVYAGGTVTQLLTSAEVETQLGSVLVGGTFAFEINMSSGALTLENRGSVFHTETVSVGSNRVNGMLFRLGARSSTNSSGTGAAFPAPEGVRMGRTRVYIDSTLTRDYVPASTGSVLPDDENSQDGTLRNFATDDSQWVFYDNGTDSLPAGATYLFTSSGSTAYIQGSLAAGLTGDFELVFVGQIGSFPGSGDEHLFGIADASGSDYLGIAVSSNDVVKIVSDGKTGSSEGSTTLTIDTDYTIRLAYVSATNTASIYVDGGLEYSVQPTSGATWIPTLDVYRFFSLDAASSWGHAKITDGCAVNDLATPANDLDFSVSDSVLGSLVLSETTNSQDGTLNSFPDIHRETFFTPQFVPGLAETAVQGVARDASHFYLFNSNFGGKTEEIIKASAAGQVVDTNDSPYTSLPAGSWKMNAGAVDAGTLYVCPSDTGARLIVRYDASDLSYVSHTDISANDSFGAGLCVGHTGNLFLVAFATSGSDTLQVAEYQKDGTFVAFRAISDNLYRMQGILYDGTHYHIACDDTVRGVVAIYVLDTSFSILQRYRSTAPYDEIEGLAYFDGKYYNHDILKRPFVYTAVGGGGSTVEAVLSGGLSMGYQAAKEASLNAGFTGALSIAMATEASAQAEAALSFALSVSDAVSALVTAEAAFTVSQTLSDTTTGQTEAGGEIEGAVSFTANVAALATADAAALATISSGIEAAGSMTAIVAIPSELSAGVQVDTIATAFVGIGSNISAGILAGAQATGEAQAYAAISVDQSLGANLIAEAMAEAGLSVSSVQNVTFVGASISGDAVTPDGRRFRVALDLRTFEVSLETRSFKADQE